MFAFAGSQPQQTSQSMVVSRDTGSSQGQMDSSKTDIQPALNKHLSLGSKQGNPLSVAMGEALKQKVSQAKYDLTIENNVQLQKEIETLAKKEKNLLAQREAQEKVLQQIEIELKTEIKKEKTVKKVVQEQLECAKAATKSAEAAVTGLNKFDEQYKEFSNIQ